MPQEIESRESEPQRITELEEEIAHLTKVNEELSGEVLAQWKRIELLEKALRKLEGRFEALEAGDGISAEIVRPPHY